MTFLPDFTTSIFYANFIFYSHLKMTSERSKRRDFLALSFITKSISKRLLIKKCLSEKNSAFHFPLISEYLTIRYILNYLRNGKLPNNSMIKKAGTA